MSLFDKIYAFVMIFFSGVMLAALMVALGANQALPSVLLAAVGFGSSFIGWKTLK